MGKKKSEEKRAKSEEERAKGEEAAEKPIFGSGAEPLAVPKDDGLVRCVCTAPCAWRGYHDEGDKVMIDRKLMESDAFIKGHFKPLEPLPEGQRRQDGEGEVQGEGEGETAAGEGETAAGGNETAAGGNETAAGGNETAAGGNETAAGEGETAAGGNGQGELGLK